MPSPRQLILSLLFALQAVPYINVGGVHVEVTTVAGEVSWWITFTADCRLCTGDVPLMTASPAEAMELREVQVSCVVVAAASTQCLTTRRRGAGWQPADTP